MDWLITGGDLDALNGRSKRNVTQCGVLSREFNGPTIRSLAAAGSPRKGIEQALPRLIEAQTRWSNLKVSSAPHALMPSNLGDPEEE